MKLSEVNLLDLDLFVNGDPHQAFALLRREAPDAPWMVAGLGADVLPLIPEVVAVGGHVRVGLEDAPLGSALRNE